MTIVFNGDKGRLSGATSRFAFSIVTALMDLYKKFTNA